MRIDLLASYEHSIGIAAEILCLSRILECQSEVRGCLARLSQHKLFCPLRVSVCHASCLRSLDTCQGCIADTAAGYRVLYRSDRKIWVAPAVSVSANLEPYAELPTRQFPCPGHFHLDVRLTQLNAELTLALQ